MRKCERREVQAFFSGFSLKDTTGQEYDQQEKEQSPLEIMLHTKKKHIHASMLEKLAARQKNSR